MAKAPAVQAKDPEQADLIDKIDETPVEQTENEITQDEEVIEDSEVPEDASIKLQEQIAALKKSEEIQKNRAERYRQDAEKAQQLVKDRGSEVDKVRKEAVQSQLDAVSTALGAAQSESESAKRDIKTAINSGDVDAQAEAYERLATARANISKLEDGKFELEARIKNPPKSEEPPVQQQNGMPQRIQNWVAKNESRLSPKLWDKIKANHWDIVDDEGIPFDSDEYIESMETRIGWRKAETEDEPVVVQQRQPQQRTSIVSAPVSREAPSTPSNDRNSGQVKLTVAQREAAKIAGVSEKVYAEQLQKINKAKANGSYELKGG
jgi:hypothetical protein